MHKKPHHHTVITSVLRCSSLSIVLSGCASTSNNAIETGIAKVDTNNFGLSVQYSLTDQAFKIKPFYSPSAQDASKPNLIKTTPVVNPSATADPSNPPLDIDSIKPVLKPITLLN